MRHMPDVLELEHALAQRGVRLWVEGDTLHYRMPKGMMTSDCLAELRVHKHELIARRRAHVNLRTSEDSITGLSSEISEAWEERVAIMMYDGGLSEEAAMSAAYESVCNLMRNRAIDRPPIIQVEKEAA